MIYCLIFSSSFVLLFLSKGPAEGALVLPRKQFRPASFQTPSAFLPILNQHWRGNKALATRRGWHIGANQTTLYYRPLAGTSEGKSRLLTPSLWTLSCSASLCLPTCFSPSWWDYTSKWVLALAAQHGASEHRPAWLKSQSLWKELWALAHTAKVGAHVFMLLTWIKLKFSICFHF